MTSKLRTMLLAGVLAAGGSLATGVTEAKAQFVAATPGFSLSIGNPYGYGGYGGYGYPGALGYGAPVVAYPAPVIVPRPYVGGYGYGYRPHGYGGGYGYGRGYGYGGGRYGPYRRW